MGGLPLALTVEPMEVASDLAIFCDFDGYCGCQWNFTMALNTTFIGWLGTIFPITKLIIALAVWTTGFAFIVSHVSLVGGKVSKLNRARSVTAVSTRPYLYKFAIRLAKY
jgi:hypothetical protein